MTNTRAPKPTGTVFSRRRLLQAGGVAAATAGAGLTIPAAYASRTKNVEIDEFDYGVVTFAIMSGVMVGDTMYVGSRYLKPTRVAAFHVPSGEVTDTFMMGNGLYVEDLAYDGHNSIYAGVTNAENDVNLYRINIESGEVAEAAAIPELSVRGVTVAPDGAVFVTGTPVPSSASHLWSYNPANGEIEDFGVPEPQADQGSQVAATESTVFFGCNSPRSSKEGRGLYSIDRASKNVTEMQDDFAGLTVFDDLLVANGGVMEIDSGKWHDIGFKVSAFARDGQTLYGCTGDGVLYSVNLDDWSTTEIGPVGFENSWGILGLGDNGIVGAYRNGLVWTYDLDSGESAGYDLLETGAEGGPEQPQSIAVSADGSYAYVAGNGAIAVHDLETEEVTNLPAPGEAKDMIIVGDVTYLAIYSSLGIWEHRPGDAELTKRADMPEEQNRPQTIAWDDENGLLAIAVKSDKTEGGSLVLYDPESNAEPITHTNPLGDDQTVSAVATAGGVVYIGGYTGSRQVGDIAAWDPVEGKELWRLEDPVNGYGISSLAVLDDKLFGTTLRGPKFFVIDLDGGSPEPSYIRGIDDISSENPTLIANNGVLYGASSLRDEGDGVLFRIEATHDYQTELLVDDLNGVWSARRILESDDDGYLYTLRGYNLVRIRDLEPPQ